jgi:hypothetical protein
MQQNSPVSQTLKGNRDGVPQRCEEGKGSGGRDCCGPVRPQTQPVAHCTPKRKWCALTLGFNFNLEFTSRTESPQLSLNATWFLWYKNGNSHGTGEISKISEKSEIDEISVRKGFS